MDPRAGASKDRLFLYIPTWDIVCGFSCIDSWTWFFAFFFCSFRRISHPPLYLFVFIFTFLNMLYCCFSSNRKRTGIGFDACY